MYRFGKRSLRNLKGVEPALIYLVSTALTISEQDFAVIEGVRTLSRQKELVRDGYSWTLKSRHLTGHAVDLGAYQDGKIIWTWLAYDQIYAAMKEASLDCGISIEWGGHWKKHRDGPHYQLPRSYKT